MGNKAPIKDGTQERKKDGKALSCDSWLREDALVDDDPDASIPELEVEVEGPFERITFEWFMIGRRERSQKSGGTRIEGLAFFTASLHSQTAQCTLHSLHERKKD
jgi:hypothetical protein